MTCKEKLLSEEYYDLITDYLFTEEFREAGVPDYCFTKIDGPEEAELFAQAAARVGEQAIKAIFDTQEGSV